jgi:hypothetical protein
VREEYEMKSTLKNVRLIALAIAAVTAAILVGAASGHGGATCSGLGALEVHGQHVVGDYVTGTGGISGGQQWPPAGGIGAVVKENGGAAVPGGPGPGFHFTIPGLAPGASFCNEQAHPNGFETPTTRGR